ncbi:MAG: hypothetical protein J5717_11510 [Lachnospiraceae bacterium]|nr:hypothetical protein [Lachnospiraceae bacterium]
MKNIYRVFERLLEVVAMNVTRRRSVQPSAIEVATILMHAGLSMVTRNRIMEGNLKTLWGSDEELDPSADGRNLLGQMPEIILGPG